VTTIDLSANSLRSSVPSARTRLIYALFFFSGFPALIYQLTWQRSLFRIFGVNTESVTIVVTAFMLGLGLGSLAGGWITKARKIDALLLLGVIELATAAFGVGSLALFEQVGQLALHWSLPAAAAVNLMLVIIPTLLMGATLPILISHVARISGEIGSAVGSLYYVNTIGASVALFDMKEGDRIELIDVAGHGFDLEPLRQRVRERARSVLRIVMSEYAESVLATVAKLREAMK